MIMTLNILNKMNYYKFTVFKQIILFWCQFLSVSFANDIFQQDLSNQMKIGLADKGYKKVELKCNTDSMIVNLETEDEFLGVIYTRGSFYDKDSPCFYDTGNKRGQRSFQLKLPLDKCKTSQDGNVYSNVLVLQHDKELIMPGDAAFNLECDFSKQRDFTVETDLYNAIPVISSITLTDADPSQKPSKNEQKLRVESHINSVIITPEILRNQKEEL